MKKTRVNSVCAFFNVRCRTPEFAPNPKWQVTQVRLATQEAGARSQGPRAGATIATTDTTRTTRSISVAHIFKCRATSIYVN